MNARLLFHGAVLLALTAGLVGCSSAVDPWKGVPADKPRVLVSFTPIYCFTKAVAGEHAAVLSLLTTQGPHDYNPTAADQLKVTRANLCLASGLGLDNFIAAKIVKTSNNRGLRVVQLGETLPKGLLEHMGAVDHGDHKHEAGPDPHIWLGIAQAKAMVERIRDELSELDPTAKVHYTANAASYLKELDKLQADGDTAFTGKKNRKMIATHDSLRYFAKSFKLTVEGNIQPQPGIEATGPTLKKLVETCVDEKVRLIVVEPQYAKNTAETLLRQLRSKDVTDVHLVEFDTLETAEAANLSGQYYLDKMRSNIANLAKKMQ